MTVPAKSLTSSRIVVLLVVLLSLVAAGPWGSPAFAQEGTPAGTPVSGERTTYPLVVPNCDVDLTLAAAPRRVIVMDPAAVSILSSIGSLDTVVARVGTYPTAYFSDEMNAEIAGIPELTADTGPTGGAVISLETVLDVDPDLVIGYETETITRDALARFGIGLYVIPPYCTSPPVPSFDSVYTEVRLYGGMFDRVHSADEAATALEQRVAGISAEPVAPGRTAAALYISADGSTVYAYSRLGMVDVQMTALGLTNLYADLPERVPEISVESLIDANPDVLIVLTPDPETTTADVRELVAGLPGAGAISAVADGRVYPLLFNYSEPPSPLTVDGLVLLRELLAP